MDSNNRFASLMELYEVAVRTPSEAIHAASRKLHAQLERMGKGNLVAQLGALETNLYWMSRDHAIKMLRLSAIHGVAQDVQVNANALFDWTAEPEVPSQPQEAPQGPVEQKEVIALDELQQPQHSPMESYSSDLEAERDVEDTPVAVFEKQRNSHHRAPASEQEEMVALEEELSQQNEANAPVEVRKLQRERRAPAILDPSPSKPKRAKTSASLRKRKAKQEEEESKVAQILDKRVNADGQVEYLVEWECTWEPSSALENCAKLVRKYETKSHKERNQKK